jgi:hypothetical protein
VQRMNSKATLLAAATLGCLTLTACGQGAAGPGLTVEAGTAPSSSSLAGLSATEILDRTVATLTSASSARFVLKGFDDPVTPPEKPDHGAYTGEIVQDAEGDVDMTWTGSDGTGRLRLVDGVPYLAGFVESDKPVTIPEGRWFKGKGPGWKDPNLGDTRQMPTDWIGLYEDALRGAAGATTTVDEKAQYKGRPTVSITITEDDGPTTVLHVAAEGPPYLVADITGPGTPENTTVTEMSDWDVVGDVAAPDAASLLSTAESTSLGLR